MPGTRRMWSETPVGQLGRTHVSPELPGPAPAQARCRLSSGHRVRPSGDLISAWPQAGGDRQRMAAEPQPEPEWRKGLSSCLQEALPTPASQAPPPTDRPGERPRSTGDAQTAMDTPPESAEDGRAVKAPGPESGLVGAGLSATTSPDADTTVFVEPLTSVGPGVAGAAARENEHEDVRTRPPHMPRCRGDRAAPGPESGKEGPCEPTPACVADDRHPQDTHTAVPGSPGPTRRAAAGGALAESPEAPRIVSSLRGPAHLAPSPDVNGLPAAPFTGRAHSLHPGGDSQGENQAPREGSAQPSASAPAPAPGEESAGSPTVHTHSALAAAGSSSSRALSPAPVPEAAALALERKESERLGDRPGDWGAKPSGPSRQRPKQRQESARTPPGPLGLSSDTVDREGSPVSTQRTLDSSTVSQGMSGDGFLMEEKSLSGLAQAGRAGPDNEASKATEGPAHSPPLPETGCRSASETAAETPPPATAPRWGAQNPGSAHLVSGLPLEAGPVARGPVARERALGQVALDAPGPARLPLSTESPSTASDGSQQSHRPPLKAGAGVPAVPHTGPTETHVDAVWPTGDRARGTSDGPMSLEKAGEGAGVGTGEPPSRLLSLASQGLARCGVRALTPEGGTGTAPAPGGHVPALDSLMTVRGDVGQRSKPGSRGREVVESRSHPAAEKPRRQEPAGRDGPGSLPRDSAAPDAAGHCALHAPPGEGGAGACVCVASEGIASGLGQATGIPAPALALPGLEDTDRAGETLTRKAGEALCRQESPRVGDRGGEAKSPGDTRDSDPPSRGRPETGASDGPAGQDRPPDGSVDGDRPPAEGKWDTGVTPNTLCGAPTQSVRLAATPVGARGPGSLLPAAPPSSAAAPEPEEPCGHEACQPALCQEADAHPDPCAQGPWPAGGEPTGPLGEGLVRVASGGPRMPPRGQDEAGGLLRVSGSSGVLPVKLPSPENSRTHRDGEDTDLKGCFRPKGGKTDREGVRKEGGPWQVGAPEEGDGAGGPVGVVPGTNKLRREDMGPPRAGSDSRGEDLGGVPPELQEARAGGQPGSALLATLSSLAEVRLGSRPGEHGKLRAFTPTPVSLHGLHPPEAEARTCRHSASLETRGACSRGTEASYGAFGSTSQQKGVLPSKKQPPRTCKKLPCPAHAALGGSGRASQPHGPALATSPPEPIPTRAHCCLSAHPAGSATPVPAPARGPASPLPKQMAPSHQPPCSPGASQPTKESALLHRLSVLASRLAPVPGPPTPQARRGSTQLLPTGCARPLYGQLLGGSAPRVPPLALCLVAGRGAQQPGTGHWTLCSLEAVRVGLSVGAPMLPLASKLSLLPFPGKPGPPAVAESPRTFPEHCAPARLGLGGSPSCLSPPCSALLPCGSPGTTSSGDGSGSPLESRAAAVVPTGAGCSVLGLHTLLALCSPGCYRIWTKKRGLCSPLLATPRLLFTQFAQGLGGLRVPASLAGELLCSLPRSLGRVLATWSRHGPSPCSWAVPALHSTHGKLPPLDPMGSCTALPYVPPPGVEAACAASEGQRLEPAFPTLLPKSYLVRDPAVSQLLLSASDFPAPKLLEPDSVNAACPPAQSSAPQEEEEKAEPEKRPKKVSQIRIRKSIPKPDPNLTPMGLPRPKRLKKKEFSLEEIYTNKNYKSPPASRCLETIFEEPKERNGALISVSQQKRKRVLEFQDFTVPRKRRARGRVTAAGSFTRAQKAALQSQELDGLLIQKLMDLEAFLAKEEEAEGEQPAGC
ncbi:protein PRR14L isoform X3 [Erinaceus europaeus]|uniref:Protein PRR14L isoform X3 n=1 Tax=Erinaceus europaeus TaxID=9365 RepID=A0ABM3XIS5_ERIEU|nr:protein PRR14L isoform X3 [Erinaceus europaeus]